MTVIRPARDAAELAAALTLRTEVFCGEQGVTREEELDGLDDRAEHLVAVDDDGRLLATCRLLDNGQGPLRLGRMATAPGARRQGLALALLDLADLRATQRGITRIELHAQVTIQQLYARAGYIAYGEVFDSARIPHVAMGKDLPARDRSSSAHAS